jgi:hypothetical protein
MALIDTRPPGYVCYYRVSTDPLGASGLGLDPQQS